MQAALSVRCKNKRLIRKGGAFVLARDGGWYPHPYFGRKILVFLRLRAGWRCKIVKTKKLFAESSF